MIRATKRKETVATTSANDRVPTSSIFFDRPRLIRLPCASYDHPADLLRDSAVVDVQQPWALFVPDNQPCECRIFLFVSDHQEAALHQFLTETVRVNLRVQVNAATGSGPKRDAGTVREIEFVQPFFVLGLVSLQVLSRSESLGPDENGTVMQIKSEIRRDAMRRFGILIDHFASFVGHIVLQTLLHHRGSRIGSRTRLVARQPLARSLDAYGKFEQTGARRQPGAFHIAKVAIVQLPRMVLILQVLYSCIVTCFARRSRDYGERVRERAARRERLTISARSILFDESDCHRVTIKLSIARLD